MRDLIPILEAIHCRDDVMRTLRNVIKQLDEKARPQSCDVSVLGRPKKNSQQWEIFGNYVSKGDDYEEPIA